MNPVFWHEAWATGRIGFHEGKPNVFLERHLEVLGAPGRVLVPLCGKTHDMIFLASRGHEVLGVELSEKAVAEFFSDHGLEPVRGTNGPFAEWSSGPITLLVGDFFALGQEQIGDRPLTGLYDRAAIVALPEAMRDDYARHLRALMPPRSPGLVVAFEYPQEQADGPPFSVTIAELRRCYAGLALEEIDSAMADIPRFRSLGVMVTERCAALRF